MASKNQSRRAARSQAFQVLYGQEFVSAADPDGLRKAFLALPRQEESPAESPDPSGFAWELVEGVWSHAAELDEIISRFARNWRLERVGRVELTLLRLAVYEMLYRPDVPPKVAMNEALELEKIYGEEKSRAFVNGILDAAAKAMENGSLARQPERFQAEEQRKRDGD